MSEIKTVELTDKEKLERTSKFIDLQLDSVQNIIAYVLQRSNLSEVEVAAAKKRADEMVTELGDKSKYLGDLILSICFCYDGALRTMLNMIQDRVKPVSSMSLDDIVAEIFQSIKSGEDSTKH